MIIKIYIESQLNKGVKIDTRLIKQKINLKKPILMISTFLIAMITSKSPLIHNTFIITQREEAYLCIGTTNM